MSEDKYQKKELKEFKVAPMKNELVIERVG